MNWLVMTSMWSRYTSNPFLPLSYNILIALPVLYLVLVAALDTTGTVNTTAAANKIMDDIRVRTKTLFGLLSDVQEKIAWAQGRLANVSISNVMSFSTVSHHYSERNFTETISSLNAHMKLELFARLFSLCVY